MARTVIADSVDATIFYLLEMIDQGVLRLFYASEEGKVVHLSEAGLGELAGGDSVAAWDTSDPRSGRGAVPARWVRLPVSPPVGPRPPGSSEETPAGSAGAPPGAEPPDCSDL